MSRFNLREHYRNLSRSLDAQYDISSGYGHRGTKGHMRENHLMDALRAIAPDDLRFFKGEVCDSTGRRSPEFDMVASYRSNAIRLFNSPANQVVPVKTVLVVMEVKSVLSKNRIQKFDSAAVTIAAPSSTPSLARNSAPPWRAPGTRAPLARPPASRA